MVTHSFCKWSARYLQWAKPPTVDASGYISEQDSAPALMEPTKGRETKNQAWSFQTVLSIIKVKEWSYDKELWQLGTGEQELDSVVWEWPVWRFEWNTCNLKKQAMGTGMWEEHSRQYSLNVIWSQADKEQTSRGKEESRQEEATGSSLACLW